MFKYGDKLRCVTGTGWMNVNEGDILTFNQYTSGFREYVMFVEHIEENRNANDNVENWELATKPEIKEDIEKCHVHLDLIIKWANGATIQVKTLSDTWVDCSLNMPNWEASLEYRVKPPINKFQVMIDQWKAGAIIQYFDDYNQWRDCFGNAPGWFDSCKYRVKPDKFEKLKAQWKAGAIIQFKSMRTNQWQDCVGIEPDWFDLVQYRVKPDDIVCTENLYLFTDSLGKNIVIRDGYSLKGQNFTFTIDPDSRKIKSVSLVE